MGIKDKIIEKLIIKEIKKMFDKLDGKKRIISLVAVAVLGAIESYNGHCSATLACTAVAIPGWAYSVLASIGITSHLVAKKK